MGQMAAKRTKQASFIHMNLYLGVALRKVLWHGKGVFEAEALKQEREDLGCWMQEVFPGDQHRFWQSEKGLSDRPRLEADALLEALRELVEGQYHRVQHSASLVVNLLLHFRRLYRQALLKRVSEHKVLSPWLLAGNREADSERRALESWQQASYDGEEDESGVHNSDAAIPAEEEPVLSDPEQVDVVARELWKRQMAFLMSLGRAQRAEGFPVGELRAVYEAMKAIYGGACYLRDLRIRPRELLLRDRGGGAGLPGAAAGAVHKGDHAGVGAGAFAPAVDGDSGPHHARSLRGDALPNLLSQSQMRALRRACARYDQIVPFLTNLSTWVANVWKRLPKRGSQPQEGMRRRRVGSVFLEMAKQAEEDGYTRAAAGLRARDKWEWGRRLTEEEHGLMMEDAAEWVLRVYRPSLLASLPDVHTEFARILQEDSTAAAAEFARQALCMALAFWPQGAAASFPPEPGG